MNTNCDIVLIFSQLKISFIVQNLNGANMFETSGCNLGSTPSSPKIMVFNPSMDEFKDFHRYVEYMEQCNAHKAGIAKVKFNDIGSQI